MKWALNLWHVLKFLALKTLRTTWPCCKWNKNQTSMILQNGSWSNVEGCVWKVCYSWAMYENDFHACDTDCFLGMSWTLSSAPLWLSHYIARTQLSARTVNLISYHALERCWNSYQLSCHLFPSRGSFKFLSCCVTKRMLLLLAAWAGFYERSAILTQFSLLENHCVITDKYLQLFVSTYLLVLFQRYSIFFKIWLAQWRCIVTL